MKLLLTLPLATLLAAASLLAETDDRPPEPSPTDQATAEKLIKDVYKEEYMKPGPDERRPLAQKLLTEGQNAKSDAATQYVLLRESRDLAAQVADADTALAAADELAKIFKIDPSESRLKALTLLKASMRSPDGCAACAEASITLIDAAMKAENFEAASKIADLAAIFAAGGKNMQQITDVQTRKADIKACAAAYLDMKIAQDKLKSAPADPAAKFTVGVYLCLYKTDWDKGLPLLAGAPDHAWKAAAALDIASPVDVPGMLKVADAWWDLAAKSTAAKPRILVRAEFWYTLCSTNGADGLLKAKIDKRLDAIESTKTNSTLANVSDATRKILPTIAEISRIKEIAATVRTNSARLEEMNDLIQEIQTRLLTDVWTLKETDYVARIRADAQIHKIVDAAAPGYTRARPMWQVSLASYFSQSKTKEDLIARLITVEKFVAAEKAIDQTQFDNCVYAGAMNFMSAHYQQYAAPKDRVDFCAFLQTKGVKSDGIERARAYYARSLRTSVP